MGVYVRADSQYFWLGLEREGKPILREATRVPARHSSPAQAAECRRQAQDIYVHRMVELARADTLGEAAPVQSQPRLRRLRRSPEGWCYIYFIQDGPLVKIGRATNPNKRLSTLQTGNGRSFNVPVMIPGHAIIETAIQQRFARLREQGEWFRLEPALSKFIAQLQQGKNPIALLWE